MNQPPTEKDRQRLSFTLIELLVVIAIIAILAAMLLPALSKAREAAHGAKCMTMQKQLGITFTMYADEYDDWSIGRSTFYSPSQNKQISWPCLFMKDDANAGSVTQFTAATLKKHLYCATANGNAPSAVNNPGFGYITVNEELCNSMDRKGYAWKTDTRTASAYRSFFKPSTVKLPGRVYWGKCSANYSDRIYRFWHGGQTLLLFIDLSVQKLAMHQIRPNSSAVYTTEWSRYPANGSPIDYGYP